MDSLKEGRTVTTKLDRRALKLDTICRWAEWRESIDDRMPSECGPVVELELGYRAASMLLRGQR